MNQALEDGPVTVETLCGSLKHDDLRVRLEAIEALGAMGDERALEPLAAAWRECFNGGSARRHLVWLIAGLAALAAQWAGIIWDIMLLRILGSTWPVFWCVAPVARSQIERRDRGRYLLAISRAVEAIVRRHPTGRARSLVPELRAAAVDFLELNRVTRTEYRAAAARLDDLTAYLSSLPVVSEAPATRPDALPRPAEEPELTGETTVPDRA